MELCETLVQSRIVRLIDGCGSLFLSRVVFDHFISLRVVPICQDLGMPFYRNEAFLDEIFLKNGRICRQNNAATAFLSPVAECAYVARSVDCLEHERGVDVLGLIVNDLAPVLAFPPARIRSVKSTRWLQKNVGTGPDFIVDAPTRWNSWQAENQGI